MFLIAQIGVDRSENQPPRIWVICCLPPTPGAKSAALTRIPTALTPLRDLCVPFRIPAPAGPPASAFKQAFHSSRDGEIELVDTLDSLYLDIGILRAQEEGYKIWSKAPTFLKGCRNL